MINIDSVGNVKYSVYYVSCNMDYLLFNKRNPTVAKKKECSMMFSLECSENNELLYETLFNEEIMYDGTYHESWDFIQDKTNSLGRYTNLNLFFDERAKNKK